MRTANKEAAAKRSPSGSRSSPAPRSRKKKPALQIRMYRHGLGDCFLLRFARSSSDDTFNMLIDCGLIGVAAGAKETMRNVATDIAATCSNRLDVVVMTHEHWDHASGFSTQQAQDIFDAIDIGEVWYAWTEDPGNALGRKLYKERAEKVEALLKAADSLGKSANPIAVERAQSINDFLGFFGLGREIKDSSGKAIGKTRAAFEYLMHRSGVRTRYCNPSKPPITLDDVEGVRVYVLGPPQDEVLLKKSAPTKSGREVYEMASESIFTNAIGAAFSRMGGERNDKHDAVEDCPFDAEWARRHYLPRYVESDSLRELKQQTWENPAEEWRQIGDDWTQIAETLALNLDTHTNNTCLVLAFEFVETGKVFLFPADAQVGNWLSWQALQWTVQNGNEKSKVTGPDLLNRTVFYKVGHHGSHNATLRTHGLEQMESEELVAFIPVIQAQAEKNRWMSMPFTPLVKRLEKKTNGKLLRSDDAYPANKKVQDKYIQRLQESFGDVEVEVQSLYYELKYR